MSSSSKSVASAVRGSASPQKKHRRPANAPKKTKYMKALTFPDKMNVGIDEYWDSFYNENRSKLENKNLTSFYCTSATLIHFQNLLSYLKLKNISFPWKKLVLKGKDLNGDDFTENIGPVLQKMGEGLEKITICMGNNSLSDEDMQLTRDKFPKPQGKDLNIRFLSGTCSTLVFMSCPFPLDSSTAVSDTESVKGQKENKLGETQTQNDKPLKSSDTESVKVEKKRKRSATQTQKPLARKIRRIKKAKSLEPTSEPSREVDLNSGNTEYKRIEVLSFSIKAFRETNQNGYWEGFYNNNEDNFNQYSSFYCTIDTLEYLYDFLRSEFITKNAECHLVSVHLILRSEDLGKIKMNRYLGYIHCLNDTHIKKITIVSKNTLTPLEQDCAKSKLPFIIEVEVEGRIEDVTEVDFANIRDIKEISMKYTHSVAENNRNTALSEERGQNQNIPQGQRNPEDRNTTVRYVSRHMLLTPRETENVESVHPTVSGPNYLSDKFNCASK